MSKMASREFPGDWVSDVEDFANSTSHDSHNVEEYVREISKKLDRHSAVYETKADIYKLWRTAEGNPATHLKVDAKYYVIHAPSSKSFMLNAASSSSTSKQDSQVRPTKKAPISRAHRIMWLVLVLFSAVWGVVAGASFVASAGVPQDVALFGLIGNIVLGLSLFHLSKTVDWDER